MEIFFNHPKFALAHFTIDFDKILHLHRYIPNTSGSLYLCISNVHSAYWGKQPRMNKNKSKKFSQFFGKKSGPFCAFIRAQVTAHRWLVGFEVFGRVKKSQIPKDERQFLGWNCFLSTSSKNLWVMMQIHTIFWEGNNNACKLRHTMGHLWIWSIQLG